MGERGRYKRECEREKFQTMAWAFYGIEGAIYIFLLEHLNDGQLTVSRGT